MKKKADRAGPWLILNPLLYDIVPWKFVQLLVLIQSNSVLCMKTPCLPRPLIWHVTIDTHLFPMALMLAPLYFSCQLMATAV